MELMTKDPLVEEELEKKKKTLDSNGPSRLEDLPPQGSYVSAEKNHNVS